MGVSCACFLFKHMYSLHTFDGQKLAFPSMAAVLHHLEDFTLGSNPYAAHVADCHIEDNGICMPLFMARHYHVMVKIPAAADVVSQVAGLINELDPLILFPDGTPRRPEQMLPTSWAMVLALGNACQTSTEVFTPQHDFPVMDGEYKVHCMESLFHRLWSTKMGYGHLGPRVSEEVGVNARHEIHVAYALLRGDSVPDEVIEAYKEKLLTSRHADPRWLPLLLELPEYRGAFKSEYHLAGITAAFHASGIGLNASILEAVKHVMRDVLPDATYAEVDDVLFDAGLVPALPTREVPVYEQEAAFNDFAKTLHDDLRVYRTKNRIKYLDERRAQGALSKRAYQQCLDFENRVVEKDSMSWPNKVAQAIDSEDLPTLLRILDGSGNETSQRAVERAFKVKLRNVPAKERRLAIFGLAGFRTYEAVASEEERLAKVERERKELRELADARKAASNVNYMKDDGEKVPGDVFIEQAIATGCDEVVTTGKGFHTKHYLQNSKLKLGYEVHRKHGTYDFATLMLKRIAAGKMQMPKVLEESEDVCF